MEASSKEASVSEQQQGVPWKWVAVTAVGILVALIGGVFSYILSTNSSQIAELKTMIRDQNIRITTLSDKISNNQRRMAAMGATLSHYRRLARRMGYSLPKKIPFKLRRSLHIHVPAKKK
jgi:chemotaxis protein histidine kinase CheA